eukprot:749400-Pleurochrysis_carterae.AAC.1
MRLPGPGRREQRCVLRWSTDENKIKQEAREALVRDYSNRIASILATAMRPKARLNLRKLQHTHRLPMYPSKYDGVQ